MMICIYLRLSLTLKMPNEVESNQSQLVTFANALKKGGMRIIEESFQPCLYHSPIAATQPGAACIR